MLNNSLTDKLRNMEFKHHQLSEDYESVSNDLTGKETERRKLESDYDYIKRKHEDEEYKNSEKAKRIYDLETVLDKVSQENQEIKRNQEYKNR